jgi:hypothetical protein
MGVYSHPKIYEELLKEDTASYLITTAIPTDCLPVVVDDTTATCYFEFGREIIKFLFLKLSLDSTE